MCTFPNLTKLTAFVDQWNRGALDIRTFNNARRLNVSSCDRRERVQWGSLEYFYGDVLTAYAMGIPCTVRHLKLGSTTRFQEVEDPHALLCPIVAAAQPSVFEMDFSLNEQDLYHFFPSSVLAIKDSLTSLEIIYTSLDGDARQDISEIIVSVSTKLSCASTPRLSIDYQENIISVVASLVHLCHLDFTLRLPKSACEDVLSEPDVPSSSISRLEQSLRVYDVKMLAQRITDLFPDLKTGYLNLANWHVLEWNVVISNQQDAAMRIVRTLLKS